MPPESRKYPAGIRPRRYRRSPGQTRRCLQLLVDAYRNPYLSDRHISPSRSNRTGNTLDNNSRFRENYGAYIQRLGFNIPSIQRALKASALPSGGYEHGPRSAAVIRAGYSVPWKRRRLFLPHSLLHPVADSGLGEDRWVNSSSAILKSRMRWKNSKLTTRENRNPTSHTTISVFAQVFVGVDRRLGGLHWGKIVNRRINSLDAAFASSPTRTAKLCPMRSRNHSAVRASAGISSSSLIVIASAPSNRRTEAMLAMGHSPDVAVPR